MLEEHQRLLYAEKIHDLANLAIAGLVFGQSFTEKPFSQTNQTLTVVAIVMYLVLTIIAFSISRKDKKAETRTV